MITRTVFIDAAFALTRERGSERESERKWRQLSPATLTVHDFRSSSDDSRVVLLKASRDKAGWLIPSLVALLWRLSGLIFRLPLAQ